MKFETEVPEYHIQVETAYDEDNLTVGEAFALKESGDDPRGFAVKFMESEEYDNEKGKHILKFLYDTDTDLRLKDPARKAEIEKKLLDSCSRDNQCRIYVPRTKAVFNISEIEELKRKAALFDSQSSAKKDSDSKLIPDTVGASKSSDRK